jgi:hypothetical protein
MTWQLALAVAAVLFALRIIWQVRPSFGPRKDVRTGRKALVAARARAAAATTPAERAMALCDAGDARAHSIGSLTSALGYYVRAMRVDPTAAEPIVRAARGLARRPRALEALLWRRLSGAPWEGATRVAALAALTELERVYRVPLRNRIRAAAIAHALAALGHPVAVEAPTLSDPSPPQ